MENSFQIREYGSTPGDWEMVHAWWDAHNQGRVLLQNLLPPIGIIVERNGEPVAAVWCHLSVNIGVAFLDSPVTRPGMTLGESAEAMHVGLDALEETCRTHGYGVMFAFTLPTIARWLERRRGFVKTGDRVQMMKLIE